MYTVVPIDRLRHPTASEFDRRAASVKPFVIESAIDHWEALDQWTPDYLMARAGTAPVPVLMVADGNPDGKFFYGSNVGGMVQFADCLPLLTGAPARVYGAGIPIAEYLPMLAADLGRIAFVPESRQRRSQIWISGRNSKGPLHYDMDDNIHVVITGRKRFRMFEYSQSRHLYPSPLLSATPHYSRVDPQAPDLDAFPDFRAARGYDVTLERGGMVCIPQGCWHQVFTEEPSVAINFWIGKRFFSRPLWRNLTNVSVRVLIHAATSPWRAVAPAARHGAAPR
jgi:hypothetical protein